MLNTRYKIIGDNFYINDKKTYSEILDSNEKMHGLLFNARFIQGIFDDKNPENAGKYDRFGKKFDATANTDDLISHLKEWYDVGIRAITVGLQGGGPIFTFKDWSCIKTDSFSSDGKILSEDYKSRLEKLIKACDEIGIIVIVSILYQAQIHYFDDSVAIVSAIKTACEYLKTLPYQNIIIEVANEYDIGDFREHKNISSPEGIATLIDLSKEWSGNRFAVGSSGGGGTYDYIVAKHSDVILFHGNNMRRQEYANLIARMKADFPDKPIVCNEDSPMFTQLEISANTHTSWGYYNDFTKQEPPSFWNIKNGEDRFFAERLKGYITGEIPTENEFYLEGFEENTTIDGGFYVKVTARYPEVISTVEFYEDEKLLFTAYDNPHLLFGYSTWEQIPYYPSENATEFKAIIKIGGDKIIELLQKL